MKDKLINDFTEKAMQYLNTAEAFTKKEVPVYIDELLNFKFMEHILDGIGAMGFTVVIMSVAFGVIALPLAAECVFDKKKNILIYIFIYFFITSAMSVVVMKNNAIEAYKVKTAPRVYMIEYFKNGMK